MAMRLIAGASALSEFVAGYTGDCGEDAELSALHLVNPAAYPLTGAALNALVQRDNAKGWTTAANGAEPIGGIANDLSYLGLKFTNYGYSEPFTGCDWAALLDQWGGIKPIIFEYALAGQLPGDEAAVHYHFNCCVGWDPVAKTGLFADGDNYRARSNILAPYALQDLKNARVCAVLVLEYALNQEGSSTPMLDISQVGSFFYLATNGKWHCKVTNQEIGGGILLYYQQVGGSGLLGQLGPGLPLTGEIPLVVSGKNVAVQIFERGAIVYDPARVYDAPPGVSGDCYLAHIDNGTVLAWLETSLKQQLDAANAALGQAKSALQAAQTAASEAQTAATNAQQAQATAEAAEAQAKQDLAAVQAHVATLTQQLAQLQAESGPAMTLAQAVLAVVAAQTAAAKPAA